MPHAPDLTAGDRARRGGGMGISCLALSQCLHRGGRPAPRTMRRKSPTSSPSSAAGAMAAAAILFLLPANPAGAQFEWLFGQPQPQPPAAAKPGEPRGGQAKPAKPKPRKPKPTEAKAAPTGNAPAPTVEEPPPPFDAELLKLAEILGALTYLDELCATSPAGD